MYLCIDPCDDRSPCHDFVGLRPSEMNASPHENCARVWNLLPSCVTIPRPCRPDAAFCVPFRVPLRLSRA